MENETAKGLHFPQCRYSPIRRTSAFTAQTENFEAQNGEKVMKSLDARGITATFDPLGVFIRQWRFTDVRVQFSERVRAVNTRTFELFNTRTRHFVFADVFRVARGHRWVLEPRSRLARFTRYTVVVRGGSGGIRDLAGNHLLTTTWSFRTSR